MKWSKLKSLVESRMCPSLKKRVHIYSTAYGNCSCGHAWITLDKKIIANFCTRAFWNRVNGNFFRENNRWKTDNPIPEYVTFSQNRNYGFVSYGDLSRQDIYLLCWEYIHCLSIDEALASKDLLIQSLAVIDYRVGKRRLEKLKKKKLHPLVGRLLDARIKTEKKI